MVNEWRRQLGQVGTLLLLLLQLLHLAVRVMNDVVAITVDNTDNQLQHARPFLVTFN